MAGKNGRLWNIDQPAAYHSCKIKPSHMPYFGMKWEGRVCMYCVLSFGLASAPNIFTKQADMATWIITNEKPDIFQAPLKSIIPPLCLDQYMGPIETIYLNKLPNTSWPTTIHERIRLFNQLSEKYKKISSLIVHYLDDWNGGHSSPKIAWQQYQTACKIMDALGLGYNDKSTPPTPKINTLGATISLPPQTISIQNKKANEYIKIFSKIASTSKITKLYGLSAVGKGTFASQFCFGLRARIRILEVFVHQAKRLHEIIKLNDYQRNNAQIIANYIKKYATKGVALLSYFCPSWIGHNHIYTDAALTIGFGSYSSIDHSFIKINWSQLKMPKLIDNDIVFQELFAIAVAFIVYKAIWKKKFITIHCDNIGIVAILIKQSCNLKRIDLLHTLTLITDVCIKNQIRYWCVHIPGEWNIIADGLSRNNCLTYNQFPLQPQTQINCSLLAQDLLDQINFNILKFK